MQQLKKIGIRNLRSFGEKEQAIDLKKINILVGRNSCGKSTFARVFPLLKQSLGAKTEKTPILWNGSILDFGDFSTAVRDGESTISFDLYFNLDLMNSPNRFRYKTSMNDKTDKHIPLKLSLTIEEDSENIKTINTINITSHDSSISFKYSESVFFLEFLVNSFDLHGQEYSFDLKEEMSKSGLDVFAFRSSEFLPNSIEYAKLVKSTTKENVWDVEDLRDLEDYTVKEITNIIKKYFRKGTDLSAIKHICSGLLWVKPDEFTQHLEQKFSRYKVFIKAIDKKHIQKELYLKIYPLIILQSLPTYLQHINSFLKNFCNNTNYIAPVRAVSERYYRYQNLSVDEMDSTGLNLPMVINSLNTSEQQELSDWIYNNFKFHVKLEMSGQHYELKIKECSDAEFHNISDMGFGYSQLLPIIVSVWLKNRSRTRFFMRDQTEKTYVIEQPELHLHPALQYQFGIMLATVIQEDKTNSIQFIIETHSKPIIDALGDQIKASIINNNDINIILFEKNKDSQTEIRSASFTKDGYLEDWPLGFLTA